MLHRWSGQKSKDDFNDVVMLPLRSAILLRRVRAGHSMEDAAGLEVVMEGLELITPVGLKGENTTPKEMLHKLLKMKEDNQHIRCTLKEE